jgi:hypothetical protein
MQRRKFLAAATTAAIPFALGATPTPSTDEPRHLIELRTYEIKFGGSGSGILMDYLKDVYSPAIERLGCPKPRIMKELGNSEPANIWVLTSYPSADVYLQAQHLDAEPNYRSAAAKSNDVPASKPVYNRFSSQLLHAFQGMPHVADPGADAGLFELRTYEGYNEDAVRRKISMFNNEEIPLFLKVGLNPVFFGKMISGPYCPSLVYMLHFKDMADRKESWGRFGPHPEWKAMVVKEEYADSVSNIRKRFLVPA